MRSLRAVDLRGAFAVIVVVGLAACGGGDDTAPTDATLTPATPTAAASTTSAPSESAEPTAPAVVTAPAVTVTPGSLVSEPEVEKVLFAGLVEFVEAYDLANETVAVEPDERFSMTVDSLTTGPLPTGGDGFVAENLFEAGIVAGTIDSDGTISALTVLVDPDGATAGPAVTSLLLATLGTAGSFDVGEFEDTYRPFALDRIAEPDAQFWLPGPDGSPYSLVATVVQGAEPPDNLIEIAIIPIPTQNEAQVVVQFLRPELLALVDPAAG